MSKIIYLAGAIDCVSPTFATSWRQTATSRLTAVGYSILDPTAGKDLTHPDVNTTLYTPAQIVETDKAMIESANIILAEISRLDIPYVGTSMEILYAWERGIPVMVWGGTKSYWIRYHAKHVFEGLHEAIEYLEYLAEGVIE